MAALGIGWPLLSVWHPAVGFSSHSKDCWHSAGSWGDTPTTNFCPPLQGPYKLLSCPYSLYGAHLYHLPLECSVSVTPACASLRSGLSPALWQGPSSLRAFALPTSIPVISSVISQVSKLNVYPPDFPEANFIEGLPLDSWTRWAAVRTRCAHTSCFPVHEVPAAVLCGASSHSQWALPPWVEPKKFLEPGAKGI